MQPDQPSTPPSSETPTHNIQIHMPPFSYDSKTILVILLVFIVGGISGYIYTKQQTEQEKQTITVVGNATIDVDADKATIEAATDTKATTYEQATNSDKQVVEKIKAALLAAGLAEAKFKIIDSYADEDYEYGEDPGLEPVAINNTLPLSPSPTGGAGGGSGGGGGSGTANRSSGAASYYSVTSFEIALEGNELNDIEKYLNVLEFYQTDPYVSYSLSDKDKYTVKLKEEAVEDARKQAESLAKINKLSIKKVLSMQDRDTKVDPEYYYDPAVDSSSREISLTSSYEVKYELVPTFFGL